MKRLAHGRLHLALHRLTDAAGPGLLAVHALHGSSADWGDSLASWRGSVHAVDLSGHGSSDALRGGGAFPELLAADVDNALAETVIGLFKTEVIHRRGPWRSLDAVEYATLEWVDWYNHRRLLAPIGDMPPAEAEARYYEQLEPAALAA